MIRLAALAGAVAISFSAIFVRLAGVAPVTAAFFRTGYAVPVLALMWLARRSQDRRPARARWLGFASGLLLAADLVAFHASIDAIGAGLATLMANSQVIVVAAVGWVAFRERPSRLALMTLPMVMGGIALVSGLGSEDAYGDRPLLGVVLGV
ncbi:MAG: EamA family transporter, partial [Acidimicrobiia bacterium]